MVKRNTWIPGPALFAVCWTLRMNLWRSVVTLFLLCIGVFLLSHTRSTSAQHAAAASIRSYLGYDRNIYPGDEALPILKNPILGLANANSCASRALGLSCYFAAEKKKT